MQIKEYLINFKYKMSSQWNECPICMEEVSLSNCCSTECGHKFHSSCLFKNFSSSFACPMCRKELVEINEDNWTDDDEDNDDENEDDENDDDEENEDDDDEDDEDDDDEDQETSSRQQITIFQIQETLKKKGFNEKDFISLILIEYFDIKSKRENIKRCENMLEIIRQVCDNEIDVDYRDSRTYASVVLGVPRTDEQGRGPRVVDIL